MAVVEALGILNGPGIVCILSIGRLPAQLIKGDLVGVNLFGHLGQLDLFMHSGDLASLGTAAVLCSHEQINRN
ncbi:MAG: hypothetical protein IPL24_05900 [Bacteroidetes bacterium]|nr:hypothetical protein [Bacteroidota bacterium]